MERTVPQVASEEIELYLRTYYSLLRASGEVKLRSLEEVHAGMGSLLHHHARDARPDMGAFIYGVLRLPAVIAKVESVVLGQSRRMFARHGLGDMDGWDVVSAPARRRRCFYNGESTLACLITSRSDIDDLVPMLVAYQIEWNKLHTMLRVLPDNYPFKETVKDLNKRKWLADTLELEVEDLARLQTVWGSEFSAMMAQVQTRRLDLGLRLLNGSLTEYRKAIHEWWEEVEGGYPEIKERPVYFISSNAHSLVNIATGFALAHEDELVAYLEDSQDENLQKEWEAIQKEITPSSRENFFYYVLKKYLNTPQGAALAELQEAAENQLGLVRARGEFSFDIEAQVLPVKGFDASQMDPRLQLTNMDFLKNSEAVILNIDYPLGMGAYHVLAELTENVSEVLGIYVMGKAATLNGIVGDVMIPEVVYDGQSKNTYLFRNCFAAEDVSQYLVHGTVLDSQKAVSVLGTFLQNYDYMDVFYREGYSDIEMEAGPYLSAVYELARPRRYPVNEIIDMHHLSFDLGFLHYASDKPLSKGKNLGAANLSYYGMDPTYAASVAILRQIFKREGQRCG
jgi:hypothetical protein